MIRLAPSSSRLFTLCLCTLLTCTLGSTGLTLAYAQTPPGRVTQTVNIINAASKLCVATATNESRDGVNVQQASCSQEIALWDLIDLGEREFAAVNRATGKVLDVAGASHDDTANVQQWSWNGTRAQRWRIENVDSRLVRLVSQNSGKCLDVSNRAMHMGANIAQYRCHDGDNQRWQLASVAAPNRPLVLGEPVRPGGGTPNVIAGRPTGRLVYAGMIVSRATSKCVDVEKASREDGTNIRQWTCNGTPAQLWDFIEISRAEVVIVSRASGKVMDVYGSQTIDGANVAQFTWNGGNNQRWRIEQAARGFFRIVSVASNKCLDLDNSDVDDGVNVQLWECHSRENQQWRIEVLGNGIGWRNYQVGSNNFNDRYADAPPSFVVGSWRGFHPAYRSNVELVVNAAGDAHAVIDGSMRVNGYFRDGKLFMGTERFDVLAESNGFRTVQVGQPGNVVRYTRAR